MRPTACALVFIFSDARVEAMRKAGLVLGHLWCLPVTLAGLLVSLAGGARYEGLHRGALVFVSDRGLTLRFFRRYRVSAFTWGAIICAKSEGDRSGRSWQRLMEHERRHFIQACWFGPTMPLAYALCSLAAAARGGHPYWDNWLERDARAHEH